MYLKSPMVEDDASDASSQDLQGAVNIHSHRILEYARHTDAASGQHICNPYSIVQQLKFWI